MSIVLAVSLEQWLRDAGQNLATLLRGMHASRVCRSDWTAVCFGGADR